MNQQLGMHAFGQADKVLKDLLAPHGKGPTLGSKQLQAREILRRFCSAVRAPLDVGTSKSAVRRAGQPDPAGRWWRSVRRGWRDIR
jgi:hypothetical protein